MAAMEVDLGRGLGGRLIREGRDKRYARGEVMDEKAQKELWEYSEKQITILEKAGAAKRTLEKKEAEAAEKKKEAAEKKAAVDGLDGLTGLKVDGAAAKGKTPGSRRSRKA